MNKEQIKNKIAIGRGYASFEVMYDFIIDHNSPLNVAVLLSGFFDEVAEEYAALRCAPLVEALREIKEELSGQPDENNALCALVAAQKALSQYNAGKVAAPWISVEDRLPDMYVKNLFITDRGRCLIEAVDGLGNIDDYQLQEGERFTHWMPLPAPPKQ